MTTPFGVPHLWQNMSLEGILCHNCHTWSIYIFAFLCSRTVGRILKDIEGMHALLSRSSHPFFTIRAMCAEPWDVNVRRLWLSSETSN